MRHNAGMKQFYFLFLLVVLSGCSSLSEIDVPFMGDDEEKAVEVKYTDEEYYQRGLINLNQRYYKTAISEFEEVERLYPFSELVTKSQVMIAFAMYKDEQYDDAVAFIDRFARFHPADKDIAYMYYLKAMCYYERIADVKRDQYITLKALEALEELVRRHPDGDYARDARLKIDLVYDHLAGKEMEIGRFYLRDRKMVAAMNRFKRVVEKYQTTNHIEEALYRLVEANLSLGLEAEAEKYASVLGHNYPNSRWYRYAYRLVEEGSNLPNPEEKAAWYQSIPFLSDTEVEESEPIGEDDKSESFLEKIKNIF